MSSFFNKRSLNYNKVHLEHVGGIESKNIITSFLPDHTRTIIDFGIGTGLELEEIFKRFPNVEVTGLDIADNMLEILRKTYNGKNITLHFGSYLDYDFGIDLYDAALSVMTLHHYSHDVKTGLYRKIYDCLKTNGLYIENDYMLSEERHDNAQELEEFYFSEYERLKSEQGIIDENEYHYDTPCTVPNQIKMLQAAGFKDVREVWRNNGNSVMLVAEK